LLRKFVVTNKNQAKRCGFDILFLIKKLAYLVLYDDSQKEKIVWNDGWERKSNECIVSIGLFI